MDGVTASFVSSVCVVCELVLIIGNAEETTQLRRKVTQEKEFLSVFTLMPCSKLVASLFLVFPIIIE